MMKYLSAVIALFTATLTAPVTRLQAQAVYGSIVGTVNDTQGTAAVRANVTVTNATTAVFVTVDAFQVSRSLLSLFAVQ